MDIYIQSITEEKYKVTYIELPFSVAKMILYSIPVLVHFQKKSTLKSASYAQ